MRRTKYYNLGGKGRRLRDVLKWLSSREGHSWPNCVEEKPFPPPKKRVFEKDHLSLTFIGHSTVLIQIAGLNIITDPVWATRVGPGYVVGVRRVKKPGVSLQDLPKIDLILLSHNHYDHMDKRTLRFLAGRDNPKIVSSLGNLRALKKIGFNEAYEMNWWDKIDFGNDLCVTFVPAQHFSGRGVFDQNKTLWGGFVVEVAQKIIYFAADTGFGDHFKEIEKRFSHIDISLLPIGAYEPKWFMREVHMSPKEAVKAHRQLHSNQSVAIHFGSFPLSDEGIDDPLIDLGQALIEQNVDERSFVALEEGETRVF